MTICIAPHTVYFHVCSQQMDLSWNPFASGQLFMSAPELVQRLRARQCPIITEFFTALALCHTVMPEQNKGWCSQQQCAQVTSRCCVVVD